MEYKTNLFYIFFGAIISIIFFLSGLYLIPWQEINWGKIHLLPGKTITVLGEAETQEKNQIASFTAGVTVVNDNKDIAIEEVNQKIKTIIESVKSFGIKSEDIKTQNLSIYQGEETYYEEERQKRRSGQWTVSNSISIILRDIERASNLADLLSKTGATHVSGPNFSLDETQATEKSLLEKAINNAKEKGEAIAQASGRKLGKIINVSEGYQTPSIFRSLEGMEMGGGTPVEPGTSAIRKTVTVIFELE